MLETYLKHIFDISKRGDAREESFYSSEYVIKKPNLSETFLERLTKEYRRTLWVRQIMQNIIFR